MLFSFFVILEKSFNTVLLFQAGALAGERHWAGSEGSHYRDSMARGGMQATMRGSRRGGRDQGRGDARPGLSEGDVTTSTGPSGNPTHHCTCTST